MENLTAFILAGGRSSRMGSDKALLSLGEQNMLQATLRAASAVSDAIHIVGPKERYSPFGDVIEDIHPGCGPLGGIHAALSETTTDLNLVLSVDMPLMTPRFLHWLSRHAAQSPELIVLPDAAGGPQPLCAIYRRAAFDAVTQALARGEYKIAGLFSQVPTRFLSEQEIVENGFSVTIFQNVNTPTDYDELLRSSVDQQKSEPR